MISTTLNQTLSTVRTFEDYEKLKASIEEELVRAIIKKHQLPQATLTLKYNKFNRSFKFQITII